MIRGGGGTGGGQCCHVFGACRTNLRGTEIKENAQTAQYIRTGVAEVIGTAGVI